MKDIKKYDVVSKDVIAKCEELNKELGGLEDKITNRMTYVLQTLFATFGIKLGTWYFDDAPEGGLGDLWRHYHDDEIYVVTEVGSNCEKDRNLFNSVNMVIIDKFGEEWGFEGGLPTRWLFEDFEQELIDGKKKFEEAEEARKIKEKEDRSKRKEQDKALAQTAKAKLSKKELAALRRTLK
jgi:hypothetical protein